MILGGVETTWKGKHIKAIQKKRNLEASGQIQTRMESLRIMRFAIPF